MTFREKLAALVPLTNESCICLGSKPELCDRCMAVRSVKDGLYGYRNEILSLLEAVEQYLYSGESNINLYKSLESSYKALNGGERDE